MLGLVRIGIAFSLLLPTVLVGQQRPLPTFSSRQEAIRAVAAQDRTIEEARVRLQAASSAESTARTAFNESERQLRSAVLAEVRSDPQREQVQHLLNDRGVPPALAEALSRQRQTISEERATLERLRREGESNAAAGLPSNESERLVQERTVATYEFNLGWMTALADSLVRTKVARDRRDENLTNLRRAVSAKKQSEDVLRVARLERARIFYSIGKQYVPRYLTSVRVTQGEGAREVYRATVSEGGQVREIDDAIGFVLAELAKAETALAESRREFLSAENRFVETAAQWQQTHSRYSNSIMYSYAWRAGLEMADSLIAVLRNRDPASVLFELGWRITEAVTTDYRIEEPRVDATLAFHRDELARRLDEATQANRPQDLLTDNQWLTSEKAAWIASPRAFIPSGESLKNHIFKEQGMESLKGAAELILADGLITSIARASTFESKREFFNRNLYSFLDADYRNLPFVITGDATAPLIEKTKDSWEKGKLKDFAVSFGVTAVKEALTARQRQELYRAAQDVALMDITYLLRQHEYSSKGAFYRALGRNLPGLEAKIGEYLEARSQTAGSRTLSVQTNETIAADAPVRIHLQFSGPVEGAGIMIGGKQFLATGDAQGNAVTDIPAGTFTAGNSRLSVFASVRGMGLTSEFDANPRTVAYHESAASVISARPRFRDLEFGNDENHSLTVVNTKDPAREVGNPIAQYIQEVTEAGQRMAALYEYGAPSANTLKSAMDRHGVVWAKGYVSPWSGNIYLAWTNCASSLYGSTVESLRASQSNLKGGLPSQQDLTYLARGMESFRQSHRRLQQLMNEYVENYAKIALELDKSHAGQPSDSDPYYKQRDESNRAVCAMREQYPLFRPVAAGTSRSETTPANTPAPSNNANRTNPNSPNSSTTDLGRSENATLLYRVVRVLANDQLTIRSGPGATNSEVGKIPSGASGVRSLGEERQVGNSTWVKISYSGVEGWVNKSFLARQ